MEDVSKIWDYPRMGAVPDFCDVKHYRFVARKYLGTAPGVTGDSPEFTPLLVKKSLIWHHSSKASPPSLYLMIVKEVYLDW